METFTFDYLDSLNLQQQKDYLNKVLIPLNTGEHVIKINGKFEIKSNDNIKQVYINRFDEKLAKWYTKENKNIKEIVCELNKPEFYENKFNLCPSIKANYKPFTEFTDDIKMKLKIFLKYIYEVLASESKENYEYILKWFLNALKGNKNDSCMYLKGVQGIGKSTISDFIKEYVIGDDLFLETGSQPFRSSFNYITFGKLFIQISELESCSTQEWFSLSSTLKRIITSNTNSYEEKNQKRFQERNISNYIIDSNNSIKDDEGRRYYIADVSVKYKENHIYFGNIHKNCFNDEVGSAFYSYMLEYDTTGFIPQNYPITKSKLASHVKRLDPIIMFVKDHYILQNKGLNLKANDLFVDFWKMNDKKKFPRADLKKKLDDVGISIKKTDGGQFMYKLTHEELLKIANQHHWLDEFDFEELTIQENEIEIDYEILLKEKETEINELKSTTEYLKQEIKRLQLQLEGQKRITEVIPVEDKNVFKKIIHKKLI